MTIGTAWQMLSSPEERGMELTTLENSDEQMWTHGVKDCLFPTRCTIHSRSDHLMREFPQHWRWDRGLMERICPHGVGHPDPDQMYFYKQLLEPRVANAEAVHGCDGCCQQE